MGRVKYSWNRCNCNFSSPNKFIIVLPCCLLVDNNTYLIMCILKCLTGYTDDGSYDNQNAFVITIIIITITKAMKSLCSLF